MKKWILLWFGLSGLAQAEVGLDNYYTIQLGAFTDSTKLQRYIQQHELPVASLASAQVVQDKQQWVLLLHGVYPSSAAAMAEAGDLCRAHRISGCWARNIGKLAAMRVQ